MHVGSPALRKLAVACDMGTAEQQTCPACVSMLKPGLQPRRLQLTCTAVFMTKSMCNAKLRVQCTVTFDICLVHVRAETQACVLQCLSAGPFTKHGMQVCTVSTAQLFNTNHLHVISRHRMRYASTTFTHGGK